MNTACSENEACGLHFSRHHCCCDVSLALMQKHPTSLTFCLPTVFVWYSAVPSASLLAERSQPTSHCLGTSVFILSGLFSLPATSHLELTFPSAPSSPCHPLRRRRQQLWLSPTEKSQCLPLKCHSLTSLNS